MNLSDLEKRIAVLEDIEAIKKLKARYCAICDEDHNPAKITELFAPTASGKAPASGGIRGTTRFVNFSRVSRNGSASRSTTS
jgi:hypothetical protein